MIASHPVIPSQGRVFRATKLVPSILCQWACKKGCTVVLVPLWFISRPLQDLLQCRTDLIVAHRAVPQVTLGFFFPKLVRCGGCNGPFAPP